MRRKTYMLQFFRFRREVPPVSHSIGGPLLVVTSCDQKQTVYDIQSRLFADHFDSMMMINNGKMSNYTMRAQLMKYNATQYHILYRPAKNMGYQCSQRLALAETWDIVQKFDSMTFFSAPDVFPFPPLLANLPSVGTNVQSPIFWADAWYGDGLVVDIFVLTRPDLFKREWWNVSCQKGSIFEVFLKNTVNRHRISRARLGLMKSYHQVFVNKRSGTHPLSSGFWHSHNTKAVKTYINRTFSHGDSASVRAVKKIH